MKKKKMKKKKFRANNFTSLSITSYASPMHYTGIVSLFFRCHSISTDNMAPIEDRRRKILRNYEL